MLPIFPRLKIEAISINLKRGTFAISVLLVFQGIFRKYIDRKKNVERQFIQLEIVQQKIRYKEYERILVRCRSNC